MLFCIILCHIALCYIISCRLQRVRSSRSLACSGCDDPNPPETHHHDCTLSYVALLSFRASRSVADEICR